MKIEERYIVVKRKHLNETEISALQAVIQLIGGEVMDCLVVENDWPEYAPTLKLLSDRVDYKEANELGEVWV